MFPVYFSALLLASSDRVSSIETSMTDPSKSGIRIYATDDISGERLLLESDQLIVATDPETAKTLLMDGTYILLYFSFFETTNAQLQLHF